MPTQLSVEHGNVSEASPMQVPDGSQSLDLVPVKDESQFSFGQANVIVQAAQVPMQSAVEHM